MGVEVDVGCEVFVGVGDITALASRAPVWGKGLESSALAGLTLNCRIGQNIKMAISNRMDEDVSTTPRENPKREG
jgi:hypothetical protein